jgi:hypothetical protein
MLVQGETWIYFQFSAGGNPVFPAPFVEDAIFSPRHILGIFVENQMAKVAFVRVFYSILLVFMSVFVPLPSVFITIAL